MTDLYYGIDLGTGNCSVAYVADDPRQREQLMIDVRTVGMRMGESEHDGGAATSGRVPSIVAADWRRGAGADSLFGWEFLRAFGKKRRAPALLRRGVDYFTSVKSDMGTNRVYPRSAVAGTATPGQVTTLILRRLAAAVTEDDPHHHLEGSHVTITVPASFGTLARTETLDAAHAAGLAAGQVELVDEPVAALVDLLNSSDASAILGDELRNILVFDYGAGTCDLSLVRARYNRAAVNGLEVINLAISPYRRLGGDDIDRAVMREIVWPQIASEEDRAKLSARDRRLVEDTLTGTVARGLKERISRKVEAEVRRDGPDALAGSRAREVYALHARFNVEALDRQTPAQFTIRAQDFARVMAPFVADPFGSDSGSEQSLLRPVVETLARAEMAPRDLDTLVLHGGGSLNPWVRHMLENGVRPSRCTKMGSDPIFHRTPDPLTSVARGAALAGYWRHARGVDIVRPIAADDLGIVVMGGAARRLVAAGQPLPYPDEDGVEEVTAGGDELVTPGEGLTELLVPVCTGRADQPKVSGTVKVIVPAGTPAGSRVRVKLRISRDKTLDWWFAVGSGDFQKAESVADPWTMRALTGPERRLMEHRREMRALVEAGQPVPGQALVLEAHLARRAGHLDEALDAADDLIADHRPTAWLLNFKALVVSELGRQDEALAWFQHAAAADGKDPVLVGNVGGQLVAMGRFAEATPYIRQALTMNPDLAYLYEHMASVLRHGGDERGARQELDRAVALTQKQIDAAPLDPEGWYRMANVRLARGEYELAERAYSFAREINRNELYGGDSSAVVATKLGKKTWQETE